MRIQQLSEKTGITKRNIHFYIKEQLLTPKSNTTNGYYDFTEEDYKQLMLIKHFRNIGLSISNIKALLQNPASSEYYLRMHIGRLEQEIENLSQHKASILSILEHLPVNPEFNDLYTFATPQTLAKNTKITPLYDGKLVNHFLWRTFWQKEELSEYQQYLWDKINRLTDHREKNEYYAKVYDYLCKQEQKKINALYNERNAHFSRIAELSENEIYSYINEMKKNIAEFIHNHAAVKQWKAHYHTFLVPQMHIFTGDIAKLAKEMSPFFAAYQNHSLEACQQVYEWLLSDQGQPLYKEILSVLDGFVNLKDYGHAELESMNTIFKY